jgi:TPR repeat protein
VRKNIAEAVRLFELAAKYGHVEAQFNLAYAYETGQGRAKNLRAAYGWYLRAARRDTTGESAHEVARCLFWGIGRKRDRTAAYKWYVRAARRGDPEGAYAAAVARDLGDGVRRDRVLAARWYAKAKALGHVAPEGARPRATRDAKGT